jgi:hypothetical protein
MKHRIEEHSQNTPICKDMGIASMVIPIAGLTMKKQIRAKIMEMEMRMEILKLCKSYFR